ncbi:MAG: YaiI/YqxD family protein [Oscillospiraceae bacterium]|jgi:uncharacterized protein YaiI (UPF0178 family)
MKLLIDADGCPVVKLAIRIAYEFNLKVCLVSDTSHEFFDTRADEVITVSKGADSADFVIANRVLPGDLVVTQDYGLAALCLARRAVPIHQDGIRFTEDNMDAFLMARHTAKKIRNAGGRLKGPSKRTKEQDKAFEQSLRALIGELRAKEQDTCIKDY